MENKLQDSSHNEAPKLISKPDGLTLVGGELELRVDFHDMLKRIKHNNLTHELIIKAVNIKSHTGVLNVIDTTAGLGEDSFLLAAAGFNVTLYEYNPTIAALLRDGIERAMQDEDLKQIASRMTFIEGDSIKALADFQDDKASYVTFGDTLFRRYATPSPEGKALERKAIDVIYLDPMFPARQKSGMIKKKFQLLQQLEAPCMDEDALLNAAINAHPKRIVIKRPAKGPYLSNIKPSYSIQGNSIRYDCIVCN